MIDTGLQVGIDASPALAGSASFKNAVMSMADAADRSFDQIKKSIGNITGSVFNLRNALLGLGLEQFTRSIMDASMQMDRIRLTLQASSDSVQDASGNYAILREVVNKLALDLPTAAQQFAQMSAAAKGTSMQGAGVEHIFEAVSTAMTALNATSQHTEFALYAVQQMISKGVVSMEELRRQLGDNLPGAFQLSAQAMGVTTAELIHMIKQGSLLSSEFLPKLADVLIQRYGGAATQAAELTRGMINRIKTAFFDLKIAIANSDLRNAFDGALQNVLKLLKSDELRQAARELGETLGAGLKIASEAMGFLALHGSEALKVLTGFVGLKLGMWFIDVAKEVNNLRKALIELQVVQTVMSATMGLFAGGGVKTTPVKWAGTNATPTFQRLMATEGESGFNMFNKNGGMLNSSQFNMRLSSFGGDKGAAKAEFEALNMLLDKNGKLLTQNTLESRINSSAWKDASFATKSMTAAMAEQVGLMITFNALVTKGGPIILNFGKYLLGAGQAILTGGLAGLTGVLESIMGAATGAVTALMGVLAAIPVWGWIAAAIVAAGAALYAFKDNTLTIGEHSAKLKYWLQVPWDGVKGWVSDAWDAIKKFISDVGSGFTEMVHQVKTLWDDISPAFLKRWWEEFANWLSTTWLGKVMKSIKDTFNLWGAQAQAAQQEDEEHVFQDKLRRVFTPAQLHKYSTDFWHGVLGGMTESEMIAYRDEAMAAFQRAHQPAPGKDQPLPGKDKVDRVGDTIQKLYAQIKATSDLIDLNEKYIMDEDALGIAIAQTNALREAEEKIITLHLKQGDARIETIKQEYLALDLLKMRLAAVQNLRKEAVSDIHDIQNTALMTEAIKQNEVAVYNLDSQLKADAAVRKAGAGLRDDEKKWLHDIVIAMEDVHRQQELIKEGKGIEEALNPLKALSTELLHLNVLVQAGAIQWDTYNKAVYDATQKAEAARIEDLKKHGGWVDGITAGLDEVDLEFKKVGERAYSAFKNVWGQLNDDLVKFLDTGKFSLASFAQSVVHEINKAIVDNALHGLSQRLKSGLASMVADLNGDKGIWQGLKDAASTVFKGKGVITKSPAQQAADTIQQTITTATTQLQAGMQKTIDDLQNQLSALMQRAQSDNAAMMSQISGGFTNVVDTNKEQWKGAITQINEAFHKMITRVGAEFHAAIAGKGSAESPSSIDTSNSDFTPPSLISMLSGVGTLSNGGPQTIDMPITGMIDEVTTSFGDLAQSQDKQQSSMVTSIKGGWDKVVNDTDVGFRGVFTNLGQLVAQWGASKGGSGSIWGSIIGAVAGATMAGIGAYNSGGGSTNSNGINFNSAEGGFGGIYGDGGVLKFADGGMLAKKMSMKELMQGGVKKSPHAVLMGERSDHVPEAFLPMMDRKSISVMYDSMGNYYAPTPGGMKIPVTLSRYADGGMYDASATYRTNSVTPMPRSQGDNWQGKRESNIVVNQTVYAQDANSFRKSGNQIRRDLWDGAQAAKRRG